MLISLYIREGVEALYQMTLRRAMRLNLALEATQR
jgi:hypothetical protein